MSTHLPYITLINHEGQYSVWPAEQSIAHGWIRTGFAGTFEQCLQHIETVWTNLQPLHLYDASASAPAAFAPHWNTPDQMVTVPDRWLVPAGKSSSGNESPEQEPICIHELFEHAAQTTPDKIALTYHAAHMTYREVNEAAEQLADKLVQLGVKPDRIVAVLADRSFDLIISLLAILKAGGCYLGLEIGIPAARLAFILDDAAPCLVITPSQFVDRFAEQSIPLFVLDAPQPTPVAPARGAVAVTPEHLAYISYTSGSTGTPKGVCIPHRAVARLVRNTTDFSFTADDVFMLVSPVAFDASTLEMWCCLGTGARLVIYDAGIVRPDQLADTMMTERVTVVWLTAGLFQLMVHAYLSAFQHIRHVLAGGDVISVPHLELLLHTYPHLRFTNGYGPTENTTFSTCWTTSVLTEQTTVPIGTPINGTWTIICDDELQPVDIGEVGELYVAGAGLARAYLHRPAATASTFIANPWSEQPGARMFKTGDRVRQLPDGTIEFIGRVDRQVKIQGYRVEPDEIEKTIMQFQTVQSAVVMPQQDPNGNKRLIAYVQLEQTSATETEWLAQIDTYLRQHLPAYMIPWAMIALDDMPLTANGKIDRQQLPVATRSPRRLQTTYVAPRNTLESTLAALWGAKLSVEPVGIHDNFFAIGGDSLILSELIIDMEQMLDVPIPARLLYLQPTVAELSVIVEDQKQALKR
ncbi:amino acid adenylation domain-containing protein [Paenibacillus campi]|uniref:amino acid adenylation domain-containing protein n=1 Tax=Paenibacillus campi TaxID=3106031 RepID=UPI002AFF01EB|nr:amino acid adenylation domain-containing protein [Paenibacillus sp. SGZ-1009]